VLPTMAAPLSAAAATYLEAAGVELQLGHKVDSIAPGRVCLLGSAGGQQLEAATICWTAGVRASRLGRLLHERTGCPVDRGGRLVVSPDFSIPDHPAFWGQWPEAAEARCQRSMSSPPLRLSFRGVCMR
jgi:NADH dehydrogenase